MKTTKEKKIKVHSLARSTLKVERHAGTLRWGLRRMTSG